MIPAVLRILIVAVLTMQSASSSHSSASNKRARLDGRLLLGRKHVSRNVVSTVLAALPDQSTTQLTSKQVRGDLNAASTALDQEIGCTIKLPLRDSDAMRTDSELKLNAWSLQRL